MVVSVVPRITTVPYPESDGKPMGETEVHILQLIDLLFALRDFFRNALDVYVGGDMLLYFVEGDPTQFVVPDLFVARRVPKQPMRRTFKIWQEGKAPDVVIELTSSSTRREDLGNKRAVYEELGVSEYFVFDPLGEYLNPPLRGFRLVDGIYSPLAGEPLKSESLGLELRVQEKRLRLYDPERGKYLPTPDETKVRAERAEAEVARLRAEIERLRGGKP